MNILEIISSFFIFTATNDFIKCIVLNTVTVETLSLLCLEKIKNYRLFPKSVKLLYSPPVPFNLISDCISHETSHEDLRIFSYQFTLEGPQCDYQTI